jgi:putative transposase
MQLIAGRTAQEDNRRKNRHGAFWEDRYHATAIQAGDYLHQCVAFIDLNMMRAGVVNIRANGKPAGIARFRNRLAAMGLSTCWS